MIRKVLSILVILSLVTAFVFAEDEVVETIENIEVIEFNDTIEIVEINETTETTEITEITEINETTETTEITEITETVEAEDFDTPVVAEVEAIDYEMPTSISNNRFFQESVRLTKLAQDTYEFGDYEASAGFAEEAIAQALASDEYVAEQLIAEAKRLVDWAEFYNIANTHPNNVRLGRDHYETAVAYKSNQEWNQASDSAIKSIEVLSVLQAGAGTPRTAGTTTPTGTTRSAETGSTYTVRTWAVERDCFWTISGYDWVYGNPWLWRRLYEANKHKIPDPNNPDLIEPGTVLEIPR